MRPFCSFMQVSQSKLVSVLQFHKYKPKRTNKIKIRLQNNSQNAELLTQKPYLRTPQSINKCIPGSIYRLFLKWMVDGLLDTDYFQGLQIWHMLWYQIALN